MRYKRTQVYLDPEDHRALLEESHRRGVSLAGLVREIVSAWSNRPAPSARGFEAIIGLIDEGEATDVARVEETYKREAAESTLARKMGRSTKR